MQRISSVVKKLGALSWLPAFFTIAGFIAYILQAIDTARTKTSFLDEGLYVYKGWLFATGRYVPFQDYGPWTNHAVLSFLIPGYIQKWFGLGLETARYSMIVLAVLTLLGLWIFANRWGGKWWAAGAVWVMALNPAEIKLYTLALSEGLIAVMLAWMLVLAVGLRRPLWQIMLGSALAGLMILTRENLLFVLPLLFLYVLWQYGWKAGFLALTSGLLVVAIGMLWYWPEVLKLWAKVLPALPASPITPNLSSFQPPASALGEGPVPQEAATDYRVFLYFWLTFRLHFITLVSAVTVWLLWPFKSKRRWHLTGRMRTAIFLSVLFVVLLAAHMQASLFGEYCISCILLYVGYFDFVGFLLLVVAYRFLVKDLSTFRRVIVLAVIAIIIVSIGSTTYEDLSTAFARAMIERLDPLYLWHVLLNITGLPHLLLFRSAFVLLVSLLTVALFALGLLWARRFYTDRRTWSRKVGLLGINALLILGLILSPTKVLGKGNDFFDCDGSNVLASYERAGEYLRSIIPPGSQVYWDGREDAIFLYLPDVKIYPPQLNHSHSYFVGGEADALLRAGLWNDALAKQWLAEADYILIESGLKQDWVMKILQSDKYIQLKASPKTERCRWQSAIIVYKRVDSPK